MPPLSPLSPVQEALASLRPVGEEEMGEYRNGARLTFRFLERWGGTIATLPIGIQDRFFAEQRESGYLGLAAVTRALRHYLGGYRLAGSERTLVT